MNTKTLSSKLRDNSTARQRALVDLSVWLDQGDLRFWPRSAFDIAGAFGFYKQLLSQAVRYKSKWLAWTSELTQRPAHELDLEAIAAIVLGLVQLSALSGVEPWAAIDESVELVGWAGKPHLKPVVNASLRRFQREQEAYEAALNDEQKLCFSKWMVKRWADTYGAEQAAQIAEASNVEPKVWLVAHPELEVGGLAAQLVESGFETEVEDGFLQVSQPSGLFNSTLFTEGKFFVQDPSAQQVIHAALPWVKGNILDSCAAPGGKLSNLLWSRGEHIGSATALEPSSTRMKRLKQNLSRLGLEAQLLEEEAETFYQPESFDFILADVPCSATGTIGKHPEIKWNRKPYDFERNQKMQLGLVHSLSLQLKPGGCLLYSTCSLEPEENERVIEAFLAENPEFSVLPLGTYLDQYLLTLPGPGRSGSFAGLLQKKA